MTPCSDKSNTEFFNKENVIGIKLIRDEMHICNFSLNLKTPRGMENAIWDRINYTYTLRQMMPNDAEFLLMEHGSAEFIEFILTISSQFSTSEYHKKI